jgi:multisubunit Na+/H+ antiporter MnhG subunit
MAVIVHVLVWLGVATQLLCCVGLLAMRSAIDRLHFAGAATVAGPALVAAAVCVEEGLFTTNGLNAVAVALLLALLGAALSVGTARAIRLRDRGTLESSEAERRRGELRS